MVGIIQTCKSQDNTEIPVSLHRDSSLLQAADWSNKISLGGAI